MKFGSGIEAASVAWEPLGWSAEWLAEFDAFPSAVLAHHWPDVPNLGDMTTVRPLLEMGGIAAPDILVGGTPCQSFSVAGLRKGLSDERGNLTLEYVRIANEIDKQRTAVGEPECITVWENVPGVLSSSDNAFGAFLGALAGDEQPLEPSERPAAGKSSKYWRWCKKTNNHIPKWSVSGAVVGPQRAIAWRVLDAQYFGLAQRRKRVFVVASARAGFDPAAVLFEFDGVRRDSAPSRETGQEFAADVGNGVKTTGSHGEVVGALCARDYKGVGNQFVSEGKLMVAQPYEPVAKCLNAGGMNRQDYETESFVCHPLQHAVAIQGSMIGRSDKNGPQGDGLNDEVSFTLNTTDRHAVAITDIPENPWCKCLECGEIWQDKYATSIGPNSGWTPAECDRCGEEDNVRLATLDEVLTDFEESIKFIRDAGFVAEVNGNSDAVEKWREALDKEIEQKQQFLSNVNFHALAVHENQRGELRVSETHGTLQTQGGKPGQGYPCVAVHGTQDPIVGDNRAHALGRNNGGENCVYSFAPAEVGPTMGASGPPYSRPGNERVESEALAITQAAVRRLTPTECARLQGFPDNHTRIPWRGKPATECPDGPQYKAYGNSMAVAVMRWIGTRIQLHLMGAL